ncbi:hypothetical protein MMC10_000801 [Thelotrema lepadinum]|nr:hypothetical protein [Thelotrema lepadinum]
MAPKKPTRAGRRGTSPPAPQPQPQRQSQFHALLAAAASSRSPARPQPTPSTAQRRTRAPARSQTPGRVLRRSPRRAAQSLPSSSFRPARVLPHSLSQVGKTPLLLPTHLSRPMDKRVLPPPHPPPPAATGPLPSLPSPRCLPVSKPSSPPQPLRAPPSPSAALGHGLLASKASGACYILPMKSFGVNPIRRGWRDGMGTMLLIEKIE